MVIYVGEAFIERVKRDLPEHKMYVVTVTSKLVELATKPGGTMSVRVSREDFEKFWIVAPKYHKKQHPWRRQYIGKSS